MTNGTSQGLFIVVAIVIFGIFVALSQTLFGDQLSNGLVGLFESPLEQVDNSLTLGRDYSVNGDFSRYRESTFPWDTSLNGNVRPEGNWSGGYNLGVGNPTQGYHAHLNIDKFESPVMSFVNKNNQIDGVTDKRWLGFYQGFEPDSPIYRHLEVGSEIVVTVEMWSEHPNAYITSALFQPNDDSVDIHISGTPFRTLNATKEQEWETLQMSFTISEHFDFDRRFRLYIYGGQDNHYDKYINSIKVQLRR